MIQLRTICISAHLNSFCRKLNELCRGDFKFVYTGNDYSSMRNKIGWKAIADYPAFVDSQELRNEAKQVDAVITMLRELDLMESRVQSGLRTFYMGERWFKPIPVLGLRLPGVCRLLVRSYRRMARRFVELMDNDAFYVLPIGVHAAIDMMRMYYILHGKWQCFFRKPNNHIDRKIGGSIEGFPRMYLWAYFVEQTELNLQCRVVREKTEYLRILWVGRMIDWKRVDVLIDAFLRLKQSAALLLVGEGAGRKKLERQAGKQCKVLNGPCEWHEGMITFHDYVSTEDARRLMREADVYVMPSNGEEGWGAAVSDAISEGCPVISTYEAGSSVTLLRNDDLYHCDSIHELTSKLDAFKKRECMSYNSKDWSGEQAAQLIQHFLTRN